MADESEGIPGGTATVVRWVEALKPPTTHLDLWTPLEDQLRLALAQQWLLLGPGKTDLPSAPDERDELAAALSDRAGEHPLCTRMLTDYVDNWRHVYQLLDYQPALVAMQDFVGIDMEIVSVTSNDYAGTYKAGAQIPVHTFITRIVGGDWLIAGLARRLPRPGWPPTEEVIPGLRVDGN